MLNTMSYRWGAKSWNEALPLGNGRLGAMVRGGAAHETLWLNEDTLWSGYPMVWDCDDAPYWYDRARELVAEGKPAEAQQLLEQHHTGAPTQCYLPLGQIDMDFPEEDGEVLRQLDLRTGLHTVTTKRFTRICFVSHPDQVLAMRVEGRKPGDVSFSVCLSPALNAAVCLENDRATVSGYAPVVDYVYGKPQHEAGTMRYGDTDETRGMAYYAQLRLRATGGRIDRRGSGLQVVGADSAELYFDARTSFNGWDHHPVLEGKPCEQPCRQTLEQAMSRPWEKLLARHVADVTALYDRVSLDLNAPARALPTDELLHLHEAGQATPELYELYFNFGRYLTIAASREDTQAMNLQGIWNDHLWAPWNGNYTININTQMNYWPTLAVNLPECQLPLIRLIGELLESGERTARVYYGVSGFAAHHNTDIWRLSSPVGCRYPGSSCWANWNLSPGWLCQHLWERWEYTHDTDFLRNTAWPVMSAACEFYGPLLRENADGRLVLTPSTSPENNYLLPDGTRTPVARWTAMSQAILL